MATFSSINAQTVVSSLAELRTAVQNSNQDIVMTSGSYDLEDLSSDSRNIDISGSNNTVDLTDVYIKVRVGSVSTTYFYVSGDSNTVIGGEFEDYYSNGLTEITDFVAYNLDRTNLADGLGGASVVEVGGDDNLIDGLKLTVRGSYPYGYGSMYGINQYNTFGLDKRCGLLVNGVRNTLDNVEIQQRAFGHAIYMQGDADGNVVKNTLVEGRVRAYAELYEETDSNSLPYQSDYKLPESSDTEYDMPFSSSVLPIPTDQVFSMTEDGIRAYTGTGSIEVENCIVKKTRGGIRLYLGSGCTVENSTATDCGSTNFNMPAGGSISNSSGNFSYAPLSDFRLGRSNMDIEWTIIPSPNAIGSHNIADVQGNNHNIVFHRTDGPLDTEETRAIVITGNNSTIVNETEYTIILDSTASGNTIISCGTVTDNGSNNSITNSTDCEIIEEPTCSSYTSDITPPTNLASGVTYNYYEGTWDALPDFNSLTPVATGITSDFNLDEASIADYFGFSFEGYIEVSSEGEYTFYTDSDDGSALWIDGEKVVDNDGLHGSVEESGTICLEAGYHKIEVAYFEQSGGSSLTVSYEGTSFSKTTISNLYTEDESTTTTTDFVPDANKTYYIDSAYHNARLAATGESEDAYTTDESTTGSDVEWKFIDKGNGYWHIQRAEGGTTPRLRTDVSENADMQETTSSGTYTYYEITTGDITDSYFLTLPNGPSAYNRLQINSSLDVKMVSSTEHTGTWESFTITEVATEAVTETFLEAEDYDNMSGIQTEESSENGDNVGYINNGDWLRFDAVSLSGISNMNARVSSKYEGGIIEIRTGSTTGTLIGSISVTNTGGDQNWTTLNTNISTTSGIQDVYLVFTGGDGYLFNINWVEFNTNSQSNKDVEKVINVISDIAIYPNPIISTTTIKNGANSTIFICDIKGKVVFTQFISSNEEVIDLSVLATGVYYTRISNEKITSVVKIIKN